MMDTFNVKSKKQPLVIVSSSLNSSNSSTNTITLSKIVIPACATSTDTKCSFSHTKVKPSKSLPEEKQLSPNKDCTKQFVSLQSLATRSSVSKYIADKDKGRGYLLSSGSDEMLVLPAGVVAYYSTESEHEEQQQPEDALNENNELQSRLNPNVNTITASQPQSDLQPGSLGSQSENTDSTVTVVDAHTVEAENCAASCEEKLDYQGNEKTLPSNVKPNFIVGGFISPRTVRVQEMQSAVRDRMSDYKLALDCSSNPTSLENYNEFIPKTSFIPPIPTVSEQEASLASFVSVGSSQLPESSDRGTSPSCMSVSSVASSKRLEWDSAADVGYQGTNTNASSTSLSTLERITISKCASTIFGQETEGFQPFYGKHRSRQKRNDKYKLDYRSKSNSDVPTVLQRRHFALEDMLLHNSTKVHLKKIKPPTYPLTSSDDESAKLSTASQSPRRKLRKRSAVLSEKECKENSCSRNSNSGRKRSSSTGLISHGKFSASDELKTNDKLKSQNKFENSAVDNKLRNNSSQNIKSRNLPTGDQSIACEHNSSTCSSHAKSNPGKSYSESSNYTGLNLNTMQDKPQSTPIYSTLPQHRNSPIVHLANSQKNWGMHSKTCNGKNIDQSSVAQAEQSSYIEASLGKMDSNIISSSVSNIKADNSSPSTGLRDIIDQTLHAPSDDTQAINIFFSHLSQKLQKHVENLVDKHVGSEAKSTQKYSKLMRYIEFIGSQSNSSEEIKLKQDVAELIVDMCGEIQSKHEQQEIETTKESNKGGSFGGSTCITSSEFHQSRVPTASCTDASEKGAATDQPPPHSSEQRCITPVDSVGVMAYKPPTSSNVYYMAVASGGAALPDDSDQQYPVSVGQVLCHIVASGSNDDKGARPKTRLHPVKCSAPTVSEKSIEQVMEPQRTDNNGCIEDGIIDNNSKDDHLKDAKNQDRLYRELPDNGKLFPHSINAKKTTSEIFPASDTTLNSAVSLLSVKTDCSCKGGYSASASSMHSSSQSASGCASPQITHSEDDVKHNSVRNFSSIEVEGEIASILERDPPPLLSVQENTGPVPDGRKVPINDGYNYNDSSCSQPDNGKSPVRHVTQPHTYNMKDFNTNSCRIERVNEKPMNQLLNYAQNKPDFEERSSTLPVHKSQDQCHQHRRSLSLNDTSVSQATMQTQHHGGSLNRVLQDEGIGDRAAPEQAWSSTCSESAYETIRSKDRRLDEALASSFEFYRTASKDARAVGYVSSSEQENEKVTHDSNAAEPTYVGKQTTDHKISTDRATSKQDIAEYNNVEQLSQCNIEKQLANKLKSNSRQNSSRRHHLDVVKQEMLAVQKRKQYIKRIHHCIETLERLEETLLPVTLGMRGYNETDRPTTSSSQSAAGYDQERKHKKSSKLQDKENSKALLSTKTTKQPEASRKKAHRYLLTKNENVTKDKVSQSSGHHSKLDDQSHNGGSKSKYEHSSNISSLSERSLPETLPSIWSGDVTDASSKSSGLSRMEREVRKLQLTYARVGSQNKEAITRGLLEMEKNVLNAQGVACNSDLFSDDSACRLISARGVDYIRRVGSTIDSEQQTVGATKGNVGSHYNYSLDSNDDHQKDNLHADSERFKDFIDGRELPYDGELLKEITRKEKTKTNLQSPDYSKLYSGEYNINEFASNFPGIISNDIRDFVNDDLPLMTSTVKGRNFLCNDEFKAQMSKNKAKVQTGLEISSSKGNLDNSVSISIGDASQDQQSTSCEIFKDKSSPFLSSYVKPLSGSTLTDSNAAKRNVSFKSRSSGFVKAPNDGGAETNIFDEGKSSYFETAQNRDFISGHDRNKKSAGAVFQYIDKNTYSKSYKRHLLNKKVGLPQAKLLLGDEVSPPVCPPRKPPPTVPVEFYSHTERRKDRTLASTEDDSSSLLFTPRGSRVAEARKKYTNRKVSSHSSTRDGVDNNDKISVGLFGEQGETQTLSLQEALRRYKPDFVERAENRRDRITRHQRLRKYAYEYNTRVISKMPPGLYNGELLNDLLLKPVMSPVVPYKELREQNKRLCAQLPEAHAANNRRQRAVLAHANRIRKHHYTKKLVNKAVKGVVTHGHRNVVTPSR